jgi:general secretion pathway protein G
MKITKRNGKGAFTLIELMAVITIIVILAGLVVGGLSFVQERQAQSKAKIQINLIAKALEQYKMDNGVYPPTANSSTGEKSSSVLFNYLYYDSDADGKGAPDDTDQKVYLPELDPTSSKQGWTTGTPSAATPVTDPWGNEYRYRSAKSDTGTANADTENPDFDLWSAGKDGVTAPSTPADKKNRDDVKE